MNKLIEKLKEIPKCKVCPASKKCDRVRLKDVIAVVEGSTKRRHKPKVTWVEQPVNVRDHGFIYLYD